MPEIILDIGIRCALCGKDLYAQTTINDTTFVVDLCEKCVQEKWQEGWNEGYGACQADQYMGDGNEK